jgi:ABC-type multidrug transport system fused ATPase/permease subunit
MKKTQKESKGYFETYYPYFGKKMFISIFLSMFSAVSEGVGILMFLPLLKYANKEGVEAEAIQGDSVINDYMASFFISLSFENILIIILISFILKGVLVFLSNAYNSIIRADFLNSIGKNISGGFDKISYSEYLESDAGFYSNLISEQAQKAVMSFYFFSQSAAQMGNAFIYILFAFMASFEFGAFAAVAGLILILLFKSLNGKVAVISGKSVYETSRILKLTVEVFNGFQYLKGTNQLNTAIKRINNTIDRFTFFYVRSWIAMSITHSIREPLAVIFMVFIIYIQVSVFDNDLVPILVAMVLFYRSINTLVAVQTNRQNMIENFASMKVVNDYISRVKKRTTNHTVEEVILDLSNISIELKNVSFSHGDGNAPLIENLSLKIPKNSYVALVGESGSGKSTLLNLIMGLIKPDSGEIFICNNIPLSKIDNKCWTSEIGYVTQKMTLFDDTIMNNITLWKEGDVHYNRARKAIHDVGMLDFVESLSEGLHTKVGDSGSKLSGGQIQRICIARELYRNPKLLILDESTSALDVKTEDIIRTMLRRVSKNMTILVITHRMSILEDVDYVIDMSSGSIVKQDEWPMPIKL